MSDTYAIIRETQYYVEGDERSRTHPGHGYPGGYEKRTEYTEYSSIERLKIAISNMDKYAKYRVVKVIPVTIETKTEIIVKE